MVDIWLVLQSRSLPPEAEIYTMVGQKKQYSIPIPHRTTPYRVFLTYLVHRVCLSVFVTVSFRVGLHFMEVMRPTVRDKHDKKQENHFSRLDFLFENGCVLQ